MTFDATYSVGLLDFQKEAINMIKGGGKNILHTRLVDRYYSNNQNDLLRNKLSYIKEHFHIFQLENFNFFYIFAHRTLNLKPDPQPRTYILRV